MLAPETATLAAAVRSGNLAAARRDWLTAHLQYETLGDAYDAFGNFDTEIDGRADATGVTSPQWTGFYRLEYGLWHGQSLSVARARRQHAQQRRRPARHWWQTQEVPLADLGRRAHEIIENALEFQLTGHDDYGSGTTLASTVANISRQPRAARPAAPAARAQVPGAARGLRRAQPAAVAAARRNNCRTDGGFPSRRCPTAARQAIDAACGQVLQELAPDRVDHRAEEHRP